jgi:hypothetical protein
MADISGGTVTMLVLNFINTERCEYGVQNGTASHSRENRNCSVVLRHMELALRLRGATELRE